MSGRTELKFDKIGYWSEVKLDIIKDYAFAYSTIVAGRPDVHVHEGDGNDILLKDVFPKVLYKDYRRGLCLLDPYGLDLKWEVVKTAGQMKSIDIFLNFPVADINRNVLW